MFAFVFVESFRTEGYQLDLIVSSRKILHYQWILFYVLLYWRYFFFFYFAIGTDKVMYSSVFLLDNHIDLQILLLILWLWSWSRN